MKKLWAVLMVLPLILSCIACFSEESGSVFFAAESTEVAPTDELAAAFSGSKAVRLIPAIPSAFSEKTEELLGQSGEIAQEGQFLELSPDGRTAVCVISMKKESDEAELQDKETAEKETTVRFCLIRDGQSIPIAVNTARGDGDPHEIMEFVLNLQSKRSIGAEGLSWSADGRYFTFSNVLSTLKMASAVSTSIYVPVIDTVTAEMWLADSFEKTKDRDKKGVIYLCKMSRDGEYVYYLASIAEEGSGYCFCRCATEGGTREILCRTPRKSSMPYDLYGTPDLYETADGSWLMVDCSYDALSKNTEIVLVRFQPSGEGWDAEIIPTALPVFQSYRFNYSAETGYGLSVLEFPIMAIKYFASKTEQKLENQQFWYNITNLINLMRIRPGKEQFFDVWQIQQKSEDPADVEMVPSEPFVQYLQQQLAGTPAEFPEGFNMKEYAQRGHLRIYNACLSPDGRYALLYAQKDGGRNAYLFLLNVETMEVRLVETPEGTLGRQLIANNAFGARYKPGITWHNDGTLTILTEHDGIRFFRLEVGD